MKYVAARRVRRKRNFNFDINSKRARRDSETTLSTAYFLNSEDRPVSPEGGAGLAERGFASKEVRGYPSSRTATTLAVDIPISVVPCWVFGRRENSLARA